MRKFQSNFGSLESAVIKSSEVFDTVKNFFPVEETVSDTLLPEDKTLPPNDRFSRTLLLLSGWQMVEENFPLPIQGLMERKYSGYMLTKDKYQHVTPSSPMYAIDCEMCRTSTGTYAVLCLFNNEEIFCLPHPIKEMNNSHWQIRL